MLVLSGEIDVRRNTRDTLLTALAAANIDHRIFAAHKSPSHSPRCTKALSIGPLIQNTFTRAYQAGVNIAFGTNQGIAPHGENAKEFAYMVEAGMSPLEALRAATLNGAKVMGMQSQIGTIEAGKLADIIAVPGIHRRILR